MRRYTESNLSFIFEKKHWEIIKYDEDQKYLDVSNSLQGTKAIDFLGFYNDKNLVMFEVKGFRGYGSQKSVHDRLADGMDVLSTEIAQKVKDTVAVIVGTSRNMKTSNTFWHKAASHLTENKPFTVVAWVEEDLNTSTLKLRKKQEMSVRNAILKTKLNWLTTDIFIDNIKEQHFSFEGLTVKNI